jgi:protein-S-isoprenylcysteine O-methyltransferase Ste14
VQRASSGEQWPIRLWQLRSHFCSCLGSTISFKAATGSGTWVLGANWTLVTIAALGLMFTWWARLYLGRLSSRSVTEKADHRVVDDTGPRAIVRHPIYIGMIVAIFAAAVLKGMPIGIAGAILIALAFWIKAMVEERFLSEQLEPNGFDFYRRRAPILIPRARNRPDGAKL